MLVFPHNKEVTYVPVRSILRVEKYFPLSGGCEGQIHMSTVTSAGQVFLLESLDLDSLPLGFEQLFLYFPIWGPKEWSQGDDSVKQSHPKTSW